MYKRFQLYTPVIVTLMALAVILALITLIFGSSTLFYLCSAITLLVFAAVLIALRRANNRTRAMLEEIASGILYTGEGDFIDFPLPILTVYDGSEIIWYNRQCAETVFGGHDLRGEQLEEVLPGLNLAPEHPERGQDVVWGQRKYTAYVADARRRGEKVAVVYLVDDSELKAAADQYYRTRPSIAVIMVDNYDELTQDYKEGERAQFLSEIEEIIEQCFTGSHGFFTRVEREKFIAVIEDQSLRQIIATKFDVLDRVRSLSVNRMSATLSIGIGREAPSLFEAYQMARQALDMCLGRGGDQVAIKTLNGYDFYGGVSKGVEKRTKVKTRIIATALAELIESSGNVIVMGHRFADLDSLGSCVGMLKSVHAMGKPGVICINREKNLVGALISRLLESGFPEDNLISPEQALERINPDTLLIVLDTHVPHVLESAEVYKACKNVAVIDHHRKLVSYIDNAVIFYHEPYASSASEMVTELIQYFPSHPHITKPEAEAMLSGIMLDTKNFVLRTGVRTFEAAAYLRRLGADTVEVRKLFASTIENYQQRSAIVANAEIYKSCAIAYTEEELDNVKVVAPQAADELTTIEGVEASFVIYPHEGIINVSARSMGSINVQVIMERLGGGGHLTMAAAQFADDGVENIRKRVMEAIDEFQGDRAPSDT